MEKGIEYLEQAIREDPNYAGSHAALAGCYALMTGLDFAPPGPFSAKARAAATKALELDATSAEAHVALGVAAINQWDQSTAGRELRRAIELNPSSATARLYNAVYLLISGRFEESIAEAIRARELDPLSAIAELQLGTCYLWARRNNEAIAQFKKALEIDLNFALAYAQMAACYARKGLRAEALTAAAQARKIAPLGQDLLVDSWLAPELVRAGRPEEARKILNTWERASTTRYVDPVVIGVMHVCLGERDAAFEWFAKANRENSAGLIPSDLNLDPIRSDPRFEPLMRRFGF